MHGTVKRDLERDDERVINDDDYDVADADDHLSCLVV